jgi:hypothetical protein
MKLLAFAGSKKRSFMDFDLGIVYRPYESVIAGLRAAARHGFAVLVNSEGHGRFHDFEVRIYVIVFTHNSDERHDIQGCICKMSYATKRAA